MPTPEWTWGTAVARTDWLRTVSKIETRGRAPLRGDLMHETTRTLLAVLADLDERWLVDCYRITRAAGDPLDLAIYAWRDAGSPDIAGSPDAVPPAPVWAIVELLGHQTWAGRISEVERLGIRFLRIEVPARDVPASYEYNGVVPAHTVPGFTVDFGASSVRSIEECDEATARERWPNHRSHAGWAAPAAVPYPPPAPGMVVVRDDGTRETITGIAPAEESPAEPGGRLRPERIETNAPAWWRRAEWPHLDHVSAIYNADASPVWVDDREEMPF